RLFWLWNCFCGGCSGRLPLHASRRWPACLNRNSFCSNRLLCRFAFKAIGLSVELQRVAGIELGAGDANTTGVALEEFHRQILYHKNGNFKMDDTIIVFRW